MSLSDLSSNTSRKTAESNNIRQSFWIGLFVLFIYLICFTGIPHSIDELATTAVTESLLHGTIQVNRMEWEQSRYPPQNAYGSNGNLYSKKGLGLSIVMLPFLFIGKSIPGIGSVQLAFISMALLSAMIVVVFYHLVIDIGYSKSVAVISSLALCLGTLLWPYSKWLFSEPLAAIGLCLALFGLVRFLRSSHNKWLFVMSCGLAVAALARSSNAVITLAFILPVSGKLIANRKEDIDSQPIMKGILCFGLPLLVTALGIIAYNYWRFGTFLSYPLVPGEGFTTPLSVGVPGLLWSSGRGLLFYVPLTFLIVLSVATHGKKMLAPEYLAAAATFLITLFFYGSWYDWPGGQAWGPRFLVSIMPAIGLLCVPAIGWLTRPSVHRSRSWLLAILLALSFLAQLIGVLKNYQYQELIDSNQGQTFQELLWSWSHSPLLTYWGSLLNGAEDPIWLHRSFWMNPSWLLGLIGTVILVLLALHIHIGYRLIRNPERSPSTFQLLWLGLMTAALGLSMVFAARSDPRWLDQGDTFADNEMMRTWINNHTLPGDIVLLDLKDDVDPSNQIWKWINNSQTGVDYIGWQRKSKLTEIDMERLRLWTLSYSRVLLVLRTTAYAAPESTTENWFRQSTYEGINQWFGTQRINEFYLPNQNGEILDKGTVSWLREQPQELVYTVRRGRSPEIILIDLNWNYVYDRDLKFSVQARNEQNDLLGQVDRPLSSTSNFLDRVGLAVTRPNINIIIKLYNATTGEVVPIKYGDNQTLEYVTISHMD